MEQIVTKPWGFYKIYGNFGESVKLKELYVHPGQRLSLQRHFLRSEHWFVVTGEASVYTKDDTGNHKIRLATLNKNQNIFIQKYKWHQLANETTLPLRIIEIQFGEDCNEEDIERN